MTEVTNPQAAYQNFPSGGQLGHLEYLITPEVLEEYRLAVSYSEARYPNLAAREFLEVLTRKIGALRQHGRRRCAEQHRDRRQYQYAFHGALL